MTAQELAAIRERRKAFGERLRELDEVLYRKWVDDILVDHVRETEHEALENLVIGIYTDGCFPAVDTAITTRGGQRVTIDECDHRHSARAASFFRDGTPLAADGMELLARAQLERDFGYDDRADELMARVKDKQRELAGEVVA